MSFFFFCKVTKIIRIQVYCQPTFLFFNEFLELHKRFFKHELERIENEFEERSELKLAQRTEHPINLLRAIFRNDKLDKESTKTKFEEWYDKVAECTLREVKSVRDTIKFYEDEILNYFIARLTNASAESLNSKIK